MKVSWDSLVSSSSVCLAILCVVPKGRDSVVPFSSDLELIRCSLRYCVALAMLNITILSAIRLLMMARKILQSQHPVPHLLELVFKILAELVIGNNIF